MATPPDFTAGSVLTAAQMNAIGLWLVGSTTFTTESKPFINGCFSSNFENYRIVVSAQGSTAANLFIRMRSGTSTPETGAVYDRFGFNYVGTVNSLILANQTEAFIGDVTSVGNNRTAGAVELYGPNAARPTIGTVYVWDGNTGSVQFPSYRIETNTQYTGLELYGSTGTLTGSMRVYGYRN